MADKYNKNNKVTRKSLPHNDEAEKAVLGAMLRNATKLSEGLAKLTVNDFYPENKNHIAIFQAMLTLYTKSQPVDTKTLVEELMKTRELEISGGTIYLVELAESIVTFANFDQYIRIILDNSILRRYLVAMSEIEDDYYKNDIDDLSLFVGNANKKLQDIAEKRRTGDFQSAKEVSNSLTKEFDNLQEAATDDAVIGTPTGYPKLNRLIRGFKKGEFIALAARPGVGKTAFALNLAYNAAIKGYPVAYFSLEMPSNMLFKRLVAAESNVPFESLITGFGLSKNNGRRKIEEACNHLAGIKFYVDDTSGIQLLDIVSKVKALYAREPDLGLVIIDYIGLITTNTKAKIDSRQLEIQTITQTLKKLALELNIPIIGVAQLNRKVDERPGGEPIISDLRESGSIEQDADIVLLLHEPKLDSDKQNNAKKNINVIDNQNKAVDKMQDKVVKKNEGVEASIVNVIVAKNRSGSMGKVSLLFRKNYCKFDSPSTESENEIAALEKERVTFFSRD